MPSSFKAFHEDVTIGPGGAELDARLVVLIPRILFWWVGERGVWRPWPEPNSPERFISVSDRWDVDEYNKERARELFLRYPVLKGWGRFGPFRFSPEQAREIGEALAEISEDGDAPGAEGVAMASRFFAMAAAHNCFVLLAGD
jgi:hypothetical protein